MVVTISGKIVALIALVSILILGAAFRHYKKITDSIIKTQEKIIKTQKKRFDDLKNRFERMTEINRLSIEQNGRLLKKIEEYELSKELDEKMLLPQQEKPSSDIEF